MLQLEDHPFPRRQLVQRHQIRCPRYFLSSSRAGFAPDRSSDTFVIRSISSPEESITTA
jgi:hypothetical protein